MQMPSSALVFMTALLFSRHIWEVYGIVPDIEKTCTECSTALGENMRPSNRSATATVLPTSARSVPSIAYDPRLSSTSYTTPSGTPEAIASIQKKTGLSTDAKIGIGVAVGVVVLVLAFVIPLGVLYWRRKRRERAIMNAIDQVERAADKGGSEERIVLESRVSIVVDEEESDSDDGRSYGEHDEGLDGGRNGMSLPRRE